MEWQKRQWIKFFLIAGLGLNVLACGRAQQPKAAPQVAHAGSEVLSSKLDDDRIQVDDMILDRADYDRLFGGPIHAFSQKKGSVMWPGGKVYLEFQADIPIKRKAMVMAACFKWGWAARVRCRRRVPDLHPNYHRPGGLRPVAASTQIGHG